ncbi:universal stress protein UspA [Halorhodospira abdelmalekii]|uniref:universal stress protein n=1 Tax=Halorhodospira abdelmalekii TaxID=421629 RepID=UPI001903A56E|nr:universal stress protein [Halorhodospira abdelmalekii]MBK1734222.1 universal stress protein UspA [Halorhodospira abdelmalekii]
MFEHTVVAVHFESPHQPLLDSLGELQRYGAKEFTLVDVLRVDDPDDLSDSHREEARRRLQQKQADLERAGFKVNIQQPVGFPAPELAKIGRGYGAQLIMLGSGGEGLLREFYHGSTVLELARQTALPVLMERIHPDPETVSHGEVFSRPMLATDFSAKAVAAENLALDVAKQHGELLILHVTDEDKRVEGQESLERLAAKVREQGVEVTTRLETGTPARVVRKVVERESVSLVIIGKRGDGPGREMALGYTAQQVCRNCPCSVLLVPNEQGIWLR